MLCVLQLGPTSTRDSALAVSGKNGDEASSSWSWWSYLVILCIAGATLTLIVACGRGHHSKPTEDSRAVEMSPLAAMPHLHTGHKHYSLHPIEFEKTPLGHSPRTINGQGYSVRRSTTPTQRGSITPLRRSPNTTTTSIQTSPRLHGNPGHRSSTPKRAGNHARDVEQHRSKRSTRHQQAEKPDTHTTPKQAGNHARDVGKNRSEGSSRQQQPEKPDTVRDRNATPVRHDLRDANAQLTSTAASAQTRAPKFVQGAAPFVRGGDGGSAMFAVPGSRSPRLRLSPPAPPMHAAAPLRRVQDSDRDQGGVAVINAPAATGPGSALTHPALSIPMSLPGAPSQKKTRLLISPPALAVRITPSSGVQDVDSMTTSTDASQADSRRRQRQQLRDALRVLHALRLERHAVEEYGSTSKGSVATLKHPALVMSLPAMPSQKEARLLISPPVLSESAAIYNTADSGKGGVQKHVAAGDGHGRGSECVAVEHGSTSDGSAVTLQHPARSMSLTTPDLTLSGRAALNNTAGPVESGVSTRSPTATRAKMLLRVRQRRQETDARQDSTRDLQHLPEQ